MRVVYSDPANQHCHLQTLLWVKCIDNLDDEGRRRVIVESKLSKELTENSKSIDDSVLQKK